MLLKYTEESKLGQDIWLDQEDAALLKENEEVTLMEWGNAIVKVWLTEGASCKATKLASPGLLSG